MAESLSYSEHRYAEVNDLQTLGIWDFAENSNTTTVDDDKYWLVFIHGGAWRDPEVDLHSFEPTISHLLGDEYKALTDAKIAGFASINYRLSAHPDFPQDPATTPQNQLRDAKHPQHIEDAVAGLTLLHSLRPLGGRYILTGHSCGGFMIYQTLMGKQGAVPSPLPFPPPTAIVAFEGIFDLNGLNNRKEGGYTGFISRAFGDDRKAWDLVSPGLFNGFADSWTTAESQRRIAVIAQSPEDTLIDIDEAINMDENLRKNGLQQMLFTDLTGDHDVVREEGVHTARVLAKTIEALES